jgi:hypothetical protein
VQRNILGEMARRVKGGADGIRRRE